MAFSVNFNAAASGALSILRDTTSELSETQTRIASGLNIRSSRDDASTFGIAQGLRSDIQSNNTIIQSIALGQSTVNVATAATNNIDDTLNDIRDRIIQAQGENVDRASIQRDIDELIGSIESQVQAAEFNGTNLINDATLDDFNVLTGLTNGTADNLAIDRFDLTTTAAAANSITTDTFGNSGGGDAVANLAATFAASANPNQVTSVTIELEDPSATNNPNGDTISLTVDTSGAVDLDAVAALIQTEIQGLTGVTAGVFNDATVVASGDNTLTFTGGATTADDVQFNSISVNFQAGGLGALSNIDVNGSDTDRTNALAAIDTAQDTVRAVDSELGVRQSRLDQASSFLETLVDSLESGLSSLVDADLTEESVNLGRLQTQQQLGFQTLSIAGQQTQGLLGLFR